MLHEEQESDHVAVLLHQKQEKQTAVELMVGGEVKVYIEILNV